LKICDDITENEGALLNDLTCLTCLTCGRDVPGNMDEARELAASKLKDGSSKH
jgi:hypothetical protein